MGVKPVKKKRYLTRPLILPGEVVSQLDPFNRQFFEWDELKKVRKRGLKSSL
ncbi:hypothetical protein [Thermococcus sp. Bubb.Bath]|uniref:hypothetical protein n=1 Tax=Thermococcus sp. Bubb.Bath TaxID=1638242 RepID=UPI001438FDFD|nr:hypothetical protein [Thermococcus sp. Bubb.Bath]